MTTIKYMAALLFLTLLSAVTLAGPVNINTADAEAISAELQGLGITKAIAIVEYRKANGRFKSHEDLRQVKGIGFRTVEINPKNILLDTKVAKSK